MYITWYIYIYNLNEGKEKKLNDQKTIKIKLKKKILIELN